MFAQEEMSYGKAGAPEQDHKVESIRDDSNKKRLYGMILNLQGFLWKTK
jgi:hypothetical protein